MSGTLQAVDAAITIDHQFKSHPDVYWPAARGEKSFEYRRDDRAGGFSVGQTVRLRCYDPEKGYLHTPPLDRRITNILRGGEFELPSGYCILSLTALHSASPAAVVPGGESRLAVEVPAPDTEERAFWLDAAIYHGFVMGDHHHPNDDDFIASAAATLKLMAAAREQGRKDVTPSKPIAIERPITHADVADALDWFWNATMFGVQNGENPASCIVNGVAAVATRFRELAAGASPASTSTGAA